MSLFDPNSKDTLASVLGQQADNRTAQTKDQYSQGRKRLVAQQAHSGRLMSGVSDYPLTDLDTEESGALSGIQDSLSGALAGIPGEDWMNTQDYQRKLALANKIGNANKPSTLDEIFQGIGSIGPTAALAASFI